MASGIDGSPRQNLSVQAHFTKSGSQMDNGIIESLLKVMKLNEGTLKKLPPLKVKEVAEMLMTLNEVLTTNDSAQGVGIVVDQGYEAKLQKLLDTEVKVGSAQKPLNDIIANAYNNADFTYKTAFTVALDQLDKGKLHAESPTSELNELFTGKKSDGTDLGPHEKLLHQVIKMAQKAQGMDQMGDAGETDAHDLRTSINRKLDDFSETPHKRIADSIKTSIKTIDDPSILHEVHTMLENTPFSNKNIPGTIGMAIMLDAIAKNTPLQNNKKNDFLTKWGYSKLSFVDDYKRSSQYDKRRGEINTFIRDHVGSDSGTITTSNIRPNIARRMKVLNQEHKFNSLVKECTSELSKANGVIDQPTMSAKLTALATRYANGNNEFKSNHKANMEKLVKK